MMPNGTSRQFHTYREILDHVGAWQTVISEVQAQAATLRALIQAEPVTEVLFNGCGSTYYLARTAAPLFQSVTGIPAKAAPSSDIVLFPETLLNGEGRQLLIAFSRSGNTTETLKAIEIFQERTGGPVLAVTCYPDSLITHLTPTIIVAREAWEESVAQTRSFSSMLVVLVAMVQVLAGRDPVGLLDRLGQDSLSILDTHLPAIQQLGEDALIERFFFLGGGFYYGLACEAMLKMKEMSLSYSEAFHFLEFRHGPMSMVNERSLVVGLVSDQAFPYEANLMTEMSKLGARVLMLTPRPLSVGEGDYQIVLPEALDDAQRAPLYLPTLQLLAFYRALFSNQNPDRPTNLSAVVELDWEAIKVSKSK